jgi:tetratricopeptide (TPR) repeat protein
VVNKRTVLISILCASLIFAASVQAQTGVSLETEIQNIERSVNRRGAPPQERHAGLVRLAVLRQLSGDIDGAARNWLEAARAIPGETDDNALLICAYCLAAMGEWDRARTALEPLLSKLARARFLNTSITAITTKNVSTLAALADNPEYSSMKSEIYFLLWRLSTGQAAERWRQRLTAEFPHSPEARLAAGGVLEAGQTIALRQSPFWLFMGGLDSLPLLPSEQEGRPAPAAQAPPAPQPVPTPTPVPQPAPVNESFVRLQTGIYSQQANAQAQANRLRQAGFVPTIEERTIGESQMWAVTVPVGADQNRTLRELQSKGFEAFPLR